MTFPETPDPSPADPAPADSGSEDVPIAKVSKWGPAELQSYAVALGSLLAAYLGRDFGLSANARAIGLLAAALVAIGTGLSRAIKHHGVSMANAQVLVARANRASLVSLATNAAAPLKPFPAEPAEPTLRPSRRRRPADPPALQAPAGADGIVVKATTPRRR